MALVFERLVLFVHWVCKQREHKWTAFHLVCKMPFWIWHKVPLLKPTPAEPDGDPDHTGGLNVSVSWSGCLVSQEGLVYAVEFSHRSGRDLLNVAKKRTNIIPIIEDARHPHKYRMLVGKSAEHPGTQTRPGLAFYCCYFYSSIKSRREL